HHESEGLATQHSPDPYIKGQSRWEAFWRTLICDTGNIEKRPAEDKFGEDYRHFLSVLQVGQIAYSPDLLQAQDFTPYIEASMNYAGVTGEDRTKILSLMSDPSKFSFRDINISDLLRGSG